MKKIVSSYLNLPLIVEHLDSARYSASHLPIYKYKLLGVIYCSDNHLSYNLLKDYCDNVNQLVADLTDIGLITLTTSDNPGKGKAARTYTVNGRFLSGTPTELTITDKEYSVVMSVVNKNIKRGQEANAPANRISLSVGVDDIPSIITTESVLNPGLNDPSVATRQAELLIDLVTGNFNSNRSRASRCYSTLTELKSCFHKYITIDGASLVGLDQSATYLTILPAIMDSIADKMDMPNVIADSEYGRLRLEIASFRSLISRDIDIYSLIAGMDAVDPEVRASVKSEVNKWLCWSNQGAKAKACPRVDQFFVTRFPLIKKHLDLSYKSFPVAKRLNAIESNIFVKAAKILNTHGFYCLVKHDCLLVKANEIKDAQSVLLLCFVASRVGMNLKISDPCGLVEPGLDVNGIPASLRVIKKARLLDLQVTKRNKWQLPEVDRMPCAWEIKRDAERMIKEEFLPVKKINLKTCRGVSTWELKIKVSGAPYCCRVTDKDQSMSDEDLIMRFSNYLASKNLDFKLVVNRK